MSSMMMLSLSVVVALVLLYIERVTNIDIVKTVQLYAVRYLYLLQAFISVQIIKCLLNVLELIIKIRFSKKKNKPLD